MKIAILLFVVSILAQDKIVNIDEQIIYGVSSSLKRVTYPKVCHNTTDCQHLIKNISGIKNVFFVNLDMCNVCDYENYIPYENILRSFNLFGLDSNDIKITKNYECPNLKGCITTLCEMLNSLQSTTIECVRIGFSFK